MDRLLSSTPDQEQKRELVTADNSYEYAMMIASIERGRVPQEEEQRAAGTSAMGGDSASEEQAEEQKKPEESVHSACAVQTPTKYYTAMTNLAGSEEHRVMPEMTGEQPKANVPEAMQECVVEPTGQPTTRSFRSYCNVL